MGSICKEIIGQRPNQSSGTNNPTTQQMESCCIIAVVGALASCLAELERHKLGLLNGKPMVSRRRSTRMKQFRRWDFGGTTSTIKRTQHGGDREIDACHVKDTRNLVIPSINMPSLSSFRPSLLDMLSFRVSLWQHGLIRARRSWSGCKQR
jgi:hypothetical protein